MNKLKQNCKKMSSILGVDFQKGFKYYGPPRQKSEGRHDIQS